MGTFIVGEHHDEDAPESQLSKAIVRFAFYNVNIQNSDVSTKNWPARAERLQDDIDLLLKQQQVDCIFLCGLGHMSNSIARNLLAWIQDAIPACTHRTDDDSDLRTVTKKCFERLVHRIDREDIEVYTDEPYVALIDTRIWSVIMQERAIEMRNDEDQCAQHLMLRHNDRGFYVRVFNCYMPPTGAFSHFLQAIRNHDTVFKMLRTCTESCSGVWQPTAAWVIGRICAVAEDHLKEWACHFVESGKECTISRSGFPVTDELQKSDLALSQGIALQECKSWVGAQFMPSDANHCVIVLGELEESLNYVVQDTPGVVIKRVLGRDHFTADIKGEGQPAMPGWPS